VALLVFKTSVGFNKVPGGFDSHPPPPSPIERVKRLMRSMQAAARSIDKYIDGFPRDVRAILEKVRTTIRKAAPEAEETITYRIPTFRLKGNLVHFAAFKKHIGFFPTSTGIAKFKDELSCFKGGKGSVQFPFDQPIPYALITKIVKFRVNENLARAEAKGKKTT
jgi:uncharacterized protein YdhG (YjbR/CyaY superfamily)